MMCINIGDVAVITSRVVDYYCIIFHISKSDGINLLENSVLNDLRYIRDTFQKNQ